VSSADLSRSRGTTFRLPTRVSTYRVHSLAEKLRVHGRVDGVVMAAVEQPIETFSDLLRVEVEPLAQIKEALYPTISPNREPSMPTPDPGEPPTGHPPTVRVQDQRGPDVAPCEPRHRHPRPPTIRTFDQLKGYSISRLAWLAPAVSRLGRPRYQTGGPRWRRTSAANLGTPVRCRRTRTSGTVFGVRR
jgi:hypothetical protein